MMRTFIYTDELSSVKDTMKNILIKRYEETNFDMLENLFLKAETKLISSYEGIDLTETEERYRYKDIFRDMLIWCKNKESKTYYLLSLMLYYAHFYRDTEYFVNFEDTVKNIYKESKFLSILDKHPGTKAGFWSNLFLSESGVKKNTLWNMVDDELDYYLTLEALQSAIKVAETLVDYETRMNPYGFIELYSRGWEKLFDTLELQNYYKELKTMGPQEALIIYYCKDCIEKLPFSNALKNKDTGNYGSLCDNLKSERLDFLTNRMKKSFTVSY